MWLSITWSTTSNTWEYAAKRKVKLAVENNVEADFAVVDGQNEICLGANPNELAYIFDAVGH
jgi:hypothetical protein